MPPELWNAERLNRLLTEIDTAITETQYEPAVTLAYTCLEGFYGAFYRANGHDTKRAKPGARVDRAKLRQLDLHWHDLRHEGACRLLAEHVDIRTIQLMLGHADSKQTQQSLNITDEERRKAMTGVWERRRQLRAVSQ